MRKGKLEHLLTRGKIEGKRSRGRKIIKIQDGIAAWLGRSTAEMFVDARDRKKWKVMIAYARPAKSPGISGSLQKSGVISRSPGMVQKIPGIEGI